MADVFVSYKRVLRPRVQELVEELRRLKLDVWFDAELKAGSDYNAAINSELRGAKAVIVCWNPDAFKSTPGDVRWVVSEAQSALDARKLVPTFFEKTPLDMPWNTLHTEDLIGWRRETPLNEGWLGTLRQVGALVNRPGLAEYVKANAANDAKALLAWATNYGDDPLAAGVRERRAALEAQVASEEAEKERLKQAALLAKQARDAAERKKKEDEINSKPGAAVRRVDKGIYRVVGIILVVLTGVGLATTGVSLAGAAPGLFGLGAIIYSFLP